MDKSVPFISKAQLLAVHGTPRAPHIIDVRRAAAYDSSPVLIAGASRALDPDPASWRCALSKSSPVVVYCVHGHEVSQQAAAALITAGIEARYLEGGISAWQAAGGTTMTKQTEIGAPAVIGKPSRWITRERPKIDRIACPWLVRRFVDPSADFLYVPSHTVLAEAERQGAVAYDVPGVRLTHRGERCSFDAFIDDFGLRNEALDVVAEIVRAADTGQPEHAPQAAGLLAVSLGLSAMYSDDAQMLEAGMLVYDALYAWARLARAEVHDAKLF